MNDMKNSLGSSPLSAVQGDEGGNPLFVATPRRSAEHRLERMVLDELRAATGVAVPEGAPFVELVAVAADHELNLVKLVERAEARLAAEAGQRCPCGHRYHAFDVCGSCSCVDGPAFDAEVGR